MGALRQGFYAAPQILALGVILVCSPVSSSGAGSRPDSIGVRYGASGEADFTQAEIFLNFALPWRWGWGSGWYAQTRLETSAGWLHGNGDTAGLFTLGPGFVISHTNCPLSVEIGASPTALTRDEFGSKDLGAPIEFTSHLGLDYDVSRRIRIGYRYQHMSNAGLANHNPGQNLHLFSISYLF
ncbi:MAG TPA: acyloxyacyl hydrolase [Candidatus Dormibacteraeota bacterium]|nr:acyloxyacyl hydrolase [Candidatus Dormibacteraeota bacterium]